MGLFTKETTKAKKTTKASAAPKAMKDMYADAPVTTTKTEKAVKKNGTAVNRAYSVLLRPLVSEKASHQQTMNNQYFFAVAISANKIEIAKAVKAVYGINPVSVNVIRYEGKVRNFGRVRGKRKDWKKAIVTLPKGKTIALYEGV